MKEAPRLHIDAIRKSFGALTVLDNVSADSNSKCNILEDGLHLWTIADVLGFCGLAMLPGFWLTPPHAPGV